MAPLEGRREQATRCFQENAAYRYHSDHGRLTQLPHSIHLLIRAAESHADGWSIFRQRGIDVDDGVLRGDDQSPDGGSLEGPLC